jgi:Fe-Mn family superoxide dismutase
MSEQITRRDAVRIAGLAAVGAASAATFGCNAQANGAAGPMMGAAGTATAGLEKAFDGNKYTLPPLPYGYGDLAPMYEERTLRIHHDKHHAGYVKGLNSAIEGLASARRGGQFGEIKPLSNALAFNGSGHVLHTLFWRSMRPGGNVAVPGNLSRMMSSSFGSVDAGQTHFAEATRSVEASGWGVLAYEPIGDRLVVLQCEKHQNLAIWGVTPLLVCDVWEHAYYLQYRNERGRWVDNFMKLADWEFAGQRLAQARGE